MRTIKERLEDLDAYVIVGVGGDSGSGKTTFSNGIKGILGENLVSGFSMDDYHTEDRATRRKTGHLPLDPRYNRLDLLEEHLGELIKGKEIIKPVYNHSTGELDPEVVFEPTRVMIIEGLHPFYTEGLRNRMDLTIFVDPVRDVKWKWKLQRDVQKRGHSEEDAFKEMVAREKLFKLHIDIQKVYSEVILRIERSRYSDDRLENPQVTIMMREADIPVSHIDLNFDLAGIIGGIKKFFSMEFGKDFFYGNSYNIVTIDGLLDRENVSHLMDQVSDFVGGIGDGFPDRDDDYLNPTGFAQMLVAWRFLEKLNMILNEVEGTG